MFAYPQKSLVRITYLSIPHRQTISRLILTTANLAFLYQTGYLLSYYHHGPHDHQHEWSVLLVKGMRGGKLVLVLDNEVVFEGFEITDGGREDVELGFADSVAWIMDGVLEERELEVLGKEEWGWEGEKV
jgi:hypothetical protein